MALLAGDDPGPLAATVRIVVTWGARTATGSGVVVGRNDLLTAAHLIYWRGRLPDSVVVDAGVKSLTPVRVEAVAGFDPEDDGLVFPGDGLPGTREGAERDIALLGFDRSFDAPLRALGFASGVEAGKGEIVGFAAADDGRARVVGATYARLAPDDSYEIAAYGLVPGMSGGPLTATVRGEAAVVGLVSTGAAAVRVAGHLHWLREAMADNDRFLFRGETDRRGPPVSEQDAPAWLGLRRSDRAGADADDRLLGGEGDDVLLGRGGDDTLLGRAGADALAGGAGDDALVGGTGRDTLIGGAGVDAFAGGYGFDTVVYRGESGDHRVTRDGADHRVALPGGQVERLVGIERILFVDGALILDA